MSSTVVDSTPLCMRNLQDLKSEEDPAKFTENPVCGGVWGVTQGGMGHVMLLCAHVFDFTITKGV
jgi:hypothetical protein